MSLQTFKFTVIVCVNIFVTKTYQMTRKMAEIKHHFANSKLQKTITSTPLEMLKNSWIKSMILNNNYLYHNVANLW